MHDCVVMSAHFAHYLWHLVARVKAVEWHASKEDNPEQFALEKVLETPASKSLWETAKNLLNTCVPETSGGRAKVYIYITPDDRKEVIPRPG